MSSIADSATERPPAVQANTPQALRVFIGSSTEAKERRIVPSLVKCLRARGLAVSPWYEVFKSGEYTLDTLLEQVRQVDLALFVFSADDEREFRGRTDAVTRDNVILEYGLFTCGLGRTRVAILQEKGVELPIDVNGMCVTRFGTNERREPNNEDLEIAAGDLASYWKMLITDPPPGRLVDAGLGFERTLGRSRSQLASTARALWTFERNGLLSTQPLLFDSKQACVSTYAEALGLVKSRFWTTTFLSSGFWTRRDPDVIQANTNMMKRLERGGDVRRLFLIQQPVEDEIAAAKEHQIVDRKLGRLSAVKKRATDFKALRQNITQLLTSGCKLRIAHDSAGLYRRLPENMNFSSCDTELAMYDDWRVDLFDGGATGRITAVRCYTAAVDNFHAYRECASDYFSQLWDSGTDIEEFLSKLEQARASADARIDYESQWLAFYEFALPPEDQDLKTVEIKRVEEILRAHGKWGSLSRCLDVGTCTGRYPLFLRKGLGPDGKVTGIDDDSDCVRFAAANVSRHSEQDKRIAITQLDFSSPRFPLRDTFDVITCMLGTLSHFGRDRDTSATGGAGKSDLLQRTLERMAGLLAPNGMLILSTWSELACATHQMLGIYREPDKQRLADWTPPIAELHSRLTHAGLDIIVQAQPDVRLDLTVCRLQPRA